MKTTTDAETLRIVEACEAVTRDFQVLAQPPADPARRGAWLAAWDRTHAAARVAYRRLRAADPAFLARAGVTAAQIDSIEAQLLQRRASMEGPASDGVKAEPHFRAITMEERLLEPPRREGR